MSKGLKIFFLTTVIVAVVDQITKAVITSAIGLNTVHKVIPGLFDIVYFRNTGSAFGILRGASSLKTILMTAFTITAIIVIAFLARRARGTIQPLALSLISGGALGNLIDRLLTGSVVDFLDVHLGAYHWPAFNLADTAITTGVIISIIFMYKREGSKTASE